MKIAIVADLHLNKSVYKGVADREWPQLPFRNGDFMRSFRFICDEIVKTNPNLMVINGDIYDHFEPTNEVRGFFSSQLRRLVDAKIPVIILVGNHDVCRKHHALKDIQELGLKDIRIVEKPTIYEFKKTNFRLLLFPYSLDIEKGTVTSKEEFDKFLIQIKEAQDKENKTSLFFGHCGIQNAILNSYTDEEITNVKEITNTTTTPILKEKAYFNRNKKDICMEDLDKIGAKYVFLGDFHQFQVLDTKKCISMYSGSIERNSFSESRQKKGFVIYNDELDNENNMGCCRFIEYPHCRPMAELRGNLDQIKKKLQELDYSMYQEGIFKLSFIGEREQLIEFSSGLDELKKQILEKTNAIHIFHKQTINNKHMAELASKIEQRIDEKGHIEAADVIDVVKEIIDEKITDKEECKQVKELAIEIYKSSMEKT